MVKNNQPQSHSLLDKVLATRPSLLGTSASFSYCTSLGWLVVLLLLLVVFSIVTVELETIWAS
jgi:hypothetical protein